MSKERGMGWYAAVMIGAVGLGLAGVGTSCTTASTSKSDAGTPQNDGGGGGGGGDAEAGTPVTATCADVCRCLAQACPDYPFAPDCVTACGDPTNNPAWDLSCRAQECQAAESNHDAHCANAAGQTMCH